ncbi:polysaccharide biosynthesis/export family protein [Chelativorans salis]|uniref:Polysaccharide biosynthesis/export family protein n=1 Tax=Chelativorans salis TaxID=2978478 RepID=A0ABT2LPK0_9HYPH|nr:polysaccharide biosynthesis/export family protein [Chelativorans sp. EGI FJ00035]MCT7375583.1 polysaccharide biosynthesis/export family protein [Chelativorans sp. EGI FJ00035]
MAENRTEIDETSGLRRQVASMVLTAIVICAVCLAALPGRADELFQLRPHTRVKVTVVEWVPSLGEYREWTPLNGEYTVAQSGSISIPLVGEIPAAGRTASALASEIAKELKRQTGLVTPPVTTVEVVRYPSLYVTGSVDRPGEFEYRPGLTVLQALAMAGGRARKSDPQGGYSELEQIRYVGEVGRIDLELQRLMARRARLKAELDEKPTIEFPAETGGTGLSVAAAQVLREEEVIFKARTEAFERQLESLDELSALFSKEIAVLDEKMVAQDRQVSIAEAELKDISKLVSSGTATRSRETGLERVVADLQSERLDLAIASMRAKQRLSETNRDALSLKGQRKTEISRDLQTTIAEIEELKLRRQINERLLQATGASIARRDARVAIEENPLRFTIIRGGENGDTFEASAGTMLEPGDVLEVRLDLTEAAGEAASAAAADISETMLSR